MNKTYRLFGNDCVEITYDNKMTQIVLHESDKLNKITPYYQIVSDQVGVVVDKGMDSEEGRQEHFRLQGMLEMYAVMMKQLGAEVRTIKWKRKES